MVVPTTIRSTSAGVRPAAASACAAALDGQVGGGLALDRLVALADAGALDDPGVGGVDDLGQIVVGDDARRQDSRPRR